MLHIKAPRLMPSNNDGGTGEAAQEPSASAPPARTICDLPDGLLVRCLSHLSQEER